jgi:hypothetical protein
MLELECRDWAMLARLGGGRPIGTPLGTSIATDGYDRPLSEDGARVSLDGLDSFRNPEIEHIRNI